MIFKAFQAKISLFYCKCIYSFNLTGMSTVSSNDPFYDRKNSYLPLLLSVGNFWINLSFLEIAHLPLPWANILP